MYRTITFRSRKLKTDIIAEDLNGSIRFLSQDELESIWAMRRAMSNRPPQEVTEEIIDNLAHTKTNKDFVNVIRTVFYD